MSEQFRKEKDPFDSVSHEFLNEIIVGETVGIPPGEGKAGG